MATSTLPAPPQARADRGEDGWPRELAVGLALVRTGIVNVYFLGDPDAGDRGWILVDAGMGGAAARIREAAARRFGPDARPGAIVLTHGHFDHVGALRTLAEAWDAPVYAHPLELPYLTGRSDYPPPDPTVGGGAMAALSWLYPRSGMDLGERVRALPADGSLPLLPGWRWIHTPGHTAGHVSLWREADRSLVVGDAFVTTRQESAISVLQQRPEVHGPPMYFTPDWEAAADSVRALAGLNPRLAATGHGPPLIGPAMLERLTRLARDFATLAMPRHGRYVGAPALADERGTISYPPPSPEERRLKLAAVGLTALAAFGIAALFHRRR